MSNPTNNQRKAQPETPNDLNTSQQLLNLCKQNQLQVLAYMDCHPTHHKTLLQTYTWGRSLVLIGWGSQGYGDSFKHSPEYKDKHPNPMDRWSLRLGKAWAKALNGEALWPFTGPPYWPFLTWAQIAGVSQPSPLGMHLHSQHGLWHSYRFALALPYKLKDLPLDESYPQTSTQTHTPTEPASPSLAAACATCHAPCMQACPVDAFTTTGQYKVDLCRQEVQQNLSSKSTSNSTCGYSGCLARRACPVTTNEYSKEQIHYHMRIFAQQD